MPAWQGGPCPDCGEEMPPRLIHCRSCRRLLNDDLEDDTIIEPVFVPLQEIKTAIAIVPSGVYEGCPACARELRISSRYEGKFVRCKYCAASFTMAPQNEAHRGRKAYFADCPHCQQELRVGIKYLGQKVACKHCSGELKLQVVTPRS